MLYNSVRVLIKKGSNMLENSLYLEPPKDENEVKQIHTLCDVLENSIVNIGSPGNISIKLPVEILTLLKVFADAMSSGQALTIIPVEKQLTTQQAADLLNVSRPYLIKLLESHQIPFQLVGRHRRILMKDLIYYRQKQEQERKTKLDSLSNLSQELGLYD